MRVTTTLVAVAGAALIGSAVLGPSERPAGAGPEGRATSEAGVEHRGELHADAETGCIVVPDEPGEPPQLQRGPPPDAGSDVHAEPWPRCEPGG